MSNNPFYSALGNQGMTQMLNQLKSNPAQFLLSRKFNIPQNISDPNAIIQHLLSTGQVSQNQINNAYQMAQRFR